MPDRHLQIIDTHAELERIASACWDKQHGELITLVRRVTRERDNAIEEMHCLRQILEATKCAAS